MSRSSQDSPTPSRNGGKDSPRRLGVEPSDSYRARTEALTQDLIGSMKRLARDERHRERISKKLF